MADASRIEFTIIESLTKAGVAHRASLDRLRVVASESLFVMMRLMVVRVFCPRGQRPEAEPRVDRAPSRQEPAQRATIAASVVCFSTMWVGRFFGTCGLKHRR